MTLWGVFGVRPAPKSICTHQAHRLKKIAKKSRFCGTTVHGTLFGPDGLLRSKMVLNMFFGPLTISYDAWMMSHTKLKKLFLRLKIGPKVTFSPKSLLALCSSNIEGFKGRPLEKRLFGSLFWEGITFDWRRVRSWYWYGMKVWYGTLFGPRPTPSMCTHQAQPSIFSICGFSGILVKNFQDTLCA